METRARRLLLAWRLLAYLCVARGRLLLWRLSKAVLLVAHRGSVREDHSLTVSEIDARLDAALASLDRYQIIGLGKLYYDPDGELNISGWHVSWVGLQAQHAFFFDAHYSRLSGRQELTEFCGVPVNGVEDAMEKATRAFYQNDGMM
jgi:hypothetical protein